MTQQLLSPDSAVSLLLVSESHRKVNLFPVQHHLYFVLYKLILITVWIWSVLNVYQWLNILQYKITFQEAKRSAGIDEERHAHQEVELLNLNLKAGMEIKKQGNAEKVPLHANEFLSYRYCYIIGMGILEKEEFIGQF